jgi:hypothetical protein
MAAFFNIFSDNPLLSLIILVVIVFLAWNITLHWQVWQMRKKIKQLFKGAKATDLEGVIFEQIKRSRYIEKNLQGLEKFTRELEKMALQSIQKISVVRFNPFKDTGGDQSFCVALLDAKNNGFTLSSLFTREGTRIYTKPISDGESIYPLTKEELEAIALAIKNNREKSKTQITNIKSNLKSK